MREKVFLSNMMISLIITVLLSFWFHYSFAKDNWGLKVLIFTVDNRPLNPDLENAQYNTISAILHAEYAKYWGYDYHYYFLNQTEMKLSLMEHFPNKFTDVTFSSKYGAA